MGHAKRGSVDEATSLELHTNYCSEGTVRALDDGGTLSPVCAGD